MRKPSYAYRYVVTYDGYFGDALALSDDFARANKAFCKIVKDFKETPHARGRRSVLVLRDRGTGGKNIILARAKV